MTKELEQALYNLTQEHLAKLGDYVPGLVKKRGSRDLLLKSYSQDPVFSIFGLDSDEYLAATLSGGTVTSIHRKIGDIYEACIKTIFMTTLELPLDKVTYSATIQNGEENETRSADAYLQFDLLPQKLRKKVTDYCKEEVSKLVANPQIKLIGVGMEVRHCYQTGDSKRTQADEAMARHLLLSGILPVMPLFCNQSNPTIIKRYSSIWVIKQGFEAYDIVKTFSGFETKPRGFQRTCDSAAKELIKVKQQLLFDIEEKPVFSDRSTKSVTFQGKLGLPIHRWYRLTPRACLKI